MEILDPELLKTERFGSREDWKEEENFCFFCGARILLEDGPVWDIAGNLFCGNACRQKNFDRRKKEILK